MCSSPIGKQTNCDHHAKTESFFVPRFENHHTGFTSSLRHLRNTAVLTEAKIEHTKEHTLNDDTNNLRNFIRTLSMFSV